ncbi:hypothetical protein NJD71_12905 [Psychrobacter sp. PP-21]|nr:hypothetical protein [Psychrobacter sp. PP-21]MDX2375016.1 hypothetical protein [Psychrobacter sp. PP-21]
MKTQARYWAIYKTHHHICTYRKKGKKTTKVMRYLEDTERGIDVKQ